MCQLVIVFALPKRSGGVTGKWQVKFCLLPQFFRSYEAVILPFGAGKEQVQ